MCRGTFVLEPAVPEVSCWLWQCFFKSASEPFEFAPYFSLLWNDRQGQPSPISQWKRHAQTHSLEVGNAGISSPRLGHGYRTRSGHPRILYGDPSIPTPAVLRALLETDVVTCFYLLSCWTNCKNNRQIIRYITAFPSFLFFKSFYFLKLWLLSPLLWLGGPVTFFACCSDIINLGKGFSNPPRALER